MKWFKDHSINYKIGIGFSIMIVFMGVIGFTGHRNAKNIQHNLDETLKVRLQSIDYITGISNQIQEINTAQPAGDAWKQFEEINRYLDKMKKNNLNIDQANKKTSETNQRAIIYLISITGLGFLIAIVCAMILSRDIITRIKENIRMLTYIARGDGDLTRRLHADSKDELGELAARFNNFLAKIQHIISSIAGDSDTIASSSEELSATTDELRRGADEQALQIEQSVTTMNEMSQTIVEVARNSSEASEATKEASEIASEGKKVVEESVESIKTIMVLVGEASQNLDKYSKLFMY